MFIPFFLFLFFLFSFCRLVIVKLCKFSCSPKKKFYLSGELSYDAITLFLDI